MELRYLEKLYSKVQPQSNSTLERVGCELDGEYASCHSRVEDEDSLVGSIY